MKITWNGTVAEGLYVRLARAKEVYLFFRSHAEDCRCTCGWLFIEDNQDHEPTCLLEHYWRRAQDIAADDEAYQSFKEAVASI